MFAHEITWMADDIRDQLGELIHNGSNADLRQMAYDLAAEAAPEYASDIVVELGL